MYDVPVISVNGLDIHAIYQAAVMAIEWRTRYQEDIIIGKFTLIVLDKQEYNRRLFSAKK